jgi:outer membrane protein
MMQKNLQNQFFILLWVIVLFVYPAKAQTDLNLSLDEAVEYAMEYNKRVVNAALSVDEAGARMRENIAQFLPQLNATVDYSNFFGSSATLGDFPGFEIEFTPTSNLGVSVSQQLFSGTHIVGIKMARLYIDMMEMSRERTELEIKADVRQSYLFHLASIKTSEILTKNLDNMKDLLAKTKPMVDVGFAEEVDYDQLSVQVSMLEDALRATGRQLELSLNMLRLQLGLPADKNITLSDRIETLIKQPEIGGSLSKTFTLENNVDYRYVALQTEMAEKQVNLEKANYLPSLFGFYNFTEKLLKPELDITPNHVIGLNLNIPLFSSGARKSRVIQAQISLEKANNQKELLSEQLMIQEKQLRYNLNNAIEQYESHLTNLEVARRVYGNYQNRYQQGMVSGLDLISANNNYLQVENRYISALLQLIEAQVAMDKLLELL